MPNYHLGKKIVSSKLVLLLSLFILIFFTVNLTKVIINRQDLLSEITTLEEEIDSLQGRNQELNSLIEYFKTIDFVETEARTKLNLRKPGEKIIIVPAAPSTTTPLVNNQETARIITVQTPSTNNWQKWWLYFFEIN